MMKKIIILIIIIALFAVYKFLFPTISNNYDFIIKDVSAKCPSNEVYLYDGTKYLIVRSNGMRVSSGTLKNSYEKLSLKSLILSYKKDTENFMNYEVTMWDGTTKKISRDSMADIISQIPEEKIFWCSDK